MRLGAWAPGLSSLLYHAHARFGIPLLLVLCRGGLVAVIWMDVGGAVTMELGFFFFFC